MQNGDQALPRLSPTGHGQVLITPEPHDKL